MAVKELTIGRLGADERARFMKEVFESGARTMNVVDNGHFTDGRSVEIDLDGDYCPETLTFSFDKGVMKLSVEKIMKCECSFFSGMEIKYGPKNSYSHTAEFKLGEKAQIESADVYIMPKDGTRIWFFTSEGVIEAKIDVEMEQTPEWYCKEPDNKTVENILKAGFVD